jgi:hypothetical protein
MTPTLSRLKKPFGTAKMVDLTAVRYLAWEDAFEVDFEDGLTFLEPHSTVRKANRISPTAAIERVELDTECHEGFFVHYDNGQTAEASWAFIRELPPKKGKLTGDRNTKANRPAGYFAGDYGADTERVALESAMSKVRQKPEC